MEFTFHDMGLVLLALGLLLAAARLFGEAASRLGQPAVLGEILAGIMLGPTVLGYLAPDLQSHLFPLEGAREIVIQGVSALALTLFMFSAGMEVNLSLVRRQKRSVLTVGIIGMIIPFGIGFVGAWLFTPFFGAAAQTEQLIFSLFLGTALSISALPVIIRTLMDLKLYKSDFGMLVVSAAVIDDILGWLIFVTILGMIGGGTSGAPVPIQTIILMTAFVMVIFLPRHRRLGRFFCWLQTRMSPGGVMGLVLAGSLICAAFSEWAGIHAIFGAFIFGLALGDSGHFSESSQTTLKHFISFFMAPLFFASIGLKVDFIANLDIGLTATVVIMATVGKVGGCFWAGRLSGLSYRESWAVGFAMNSRGAMEIILGLIALQTAIITEKTFVALVIMALLTSMASGPLIQYCLQSRPPAK